jgi:hypothetical protein
VKHAGWRASKGIDRPKPDGNHRCGYCGGGSTRNNSHRDVGRAFDNHDCTIEHHTTNDRGLFHHSDNFGPNDDLATDHDSSTYDDFTAFARCARL